MQFIIVEWEVYSLTKDPLSLGLIGLVEVIPAISTALFAGHIVDQREKKMLFVQCITAFLLVAIGYYFITIARKLEVARWIVDSSPRAVRAIAKIFAKPRRERNERQSVLQAHFVVLIWISYITGERVRFVLLGETITSVYRRGDCSTIVFPVNTTFDIF